MATPPRGVSHIYWHYVLLLIRTPIALAHCATTGASTSFPPHRAPHSRHYALDARTVHGRKAEKGDCHMSAILGVSVFYVAVSVILAENPPAPQSEKAKDPHADCLMHMAHHEATSSAMNERGEK